MPHTYPYPRPAVTVDAVLLSRDTQPTQVLLIQRKKAPFQHQWAFPGGFVDENEDPNDAVARELEEETGLTGLTFRQAGFYGRPERDPRGHTISLTFLALAPPAALNPRAADDAKAVQWFPVDDLPALAFDHAQILADTLLLRES